MMDRIRTREVFRAPVRLSEVVRVEELGSEDDRRRRVMCAPPRSECRRLGRELGAPQPDVVKHPGDPWRTSTAAPALESDRRRRLRRRARTLSSSEHAMLRLTNTAVLKLRRHGQQFSTVTDPRTGAGGARRGRTVSVVSGRLRRWCRSERSAILPRWPTGRGRRRPGSRAGSSRATGRRLRSRGASRRPPAPRR
jgi:hypothetical protein